MKRAYELGRARVAFVRAALGATLVAALSIAVLGRGALGWVVASLAVVAFCEWRGGALARGARRGFVAGLVTLVLPMSILRPCCASGMSAMPMSAACCTMPSMCGVSGIVIGLAVAVVWPREKTVRAHALVGTGVALAAVSVAAVRCAGLFMGETVGLALGLLAGAFASAAARAWLGSRVRTS